MSFELVKRQNFSDEPIYWIMNFPAYRKFVFYGSEKEAVELFYKTSEREGAGLLRRADPTRREDQEIVQEEIQNVAMDRKHGVNIPALPHTGGF